jgi:hypothetical protein
MFQVGLDAVADVAGDNIAQKQGFRAGNWWLGLSLWVEEKLIPYCG